MMETAEDGVSYRFSKSFGSKQIKIFEVTEAIADAIMSGASARLLGDKNTPRTALCLNNNTTFMVKKIESSNHRLVAESSSIICDCNSYFELLPHTPILSEETLVRLLKTQYRGAAIEKEEPPQPSALMNDLELRSAIMASEEEYAVLLVKHDIIEMHGSMRIISRDAKLEILEDVFDVLIENDFPIDNIAERELIAALRDFDVNVLRSTLGGIGEVIGDKRDIWKLSFDRVCSCSALILLRKRKEGPNSLSKGEFLAEWASRTPGCNRSCPPESSLSGVALFLDDGRVKLADKESLPKELQARLRSLFAIKPELSTEELSPYFEGYFDAKTYANDLITSLLTHCIVGANKKWMIKV